MPIGDAIHETYARPVSESPRLWFRISDFVLFRVVLIRKACREGPFNFAGASEVLSSLLPLAKNRPKKVRDSVTANSRLRPRA